MKKKKQSKPVKIYADRLDQEILNYVFTERNKQYTKWGDQHRTEKQWERVFDEKYAEALCKLECGYSREIVMRELIQCAAVICAWIRDIIVKRGK
jgi:hypothetical protein